MRDLTQSRIRAGCCIANNPNEQELETFFQERLQSRGISSAPVTITLYHPEHPSRPISSDIAYGVGSRASMRNAFPESAK